MNYTGRDLIFHSIVAFKKDIPGSLEDCTKSTTGCSKKMSLSYGQIGGKMYLYIRHFDILFPYPLQKIF